MSILDYVPEGYKLREVQRKALLDIEEVYHQADIIVVPGPVGFGKSLVGTVLALWRKAKGETTGILTSQVLLQEQYASQPPYFPVLKGRGRYRCLSQCEGETQSCEQTHTLMRKYCKGCPYTEARTAAVQSDTAVFNFHSYLFNKAYKDLLFVDEAHNLMSMLSDFYTLKIWKHKTPYPQFNNKGDVALWLEGVIKQQKKDLEELKKVTTAKDKKLVWEAQRQIEKFATVYTAIDRSPSDFFVQQEEETFRGKKMEVLKIRPLNVNNIRHGLWPDSKVKKIVLSSATLNDQDIDELGLGLKKVAYLDCDSPIPVENRPFVFIPVANMGFKYQRKNAPKMAEYLTQLAASHTNSKGIVHMPYGLRWLFKPLLKGNRWMWHDQDNKEEKLKEFINSESNAILVACGMDQGIDLAGPQFAWQAIVKVQWPSLGDPLVKSQAQERPKWYVWQTVRTIIQQYGRICRGPTDFGTTYMLDTAFRNLDPESRKHLDLWPQWFRNARQGDK
jgi:Rad3-related DNA helicase